jgi:hypothetical protein
MDVRGEEMRDGREEHPAFFVYDLLLDWTAVVFQCRNIGRGKAQRCKPRSSRD